MWYVIQVRATREPEILAIMNKCYKEPQEDFFAMKCVSFRRSLEGKWQTNEKYAFPGYIFAATKDIQSLRERLRKIPELTKILGCGECVIPISEDEENLLMNLGGPEHLIKASNGYKAGDHIEIVDGALKGLESRIIWVNPHKRKACIEIEIAGRKVQTKLALDFIKIPS